MHLSQSTSSRASGQPSGKAPGSSSPAQWMFHSTLTRPTPTCPRSVYLKRCGAGCSTIIVIIIIIINILILLLLFIILLFYATTATTREHRMVHSTRSRAPRPPAPPPTHTHVV